MVSIHPQMGGLKSSSIVVPTIKGQIKGEYNKVNSQLTQYSIELPANVVGEFKVDSQDNVVVTLNDEAVNLSFGNIRLGPGVNLIRIQSNSF